MPDTRYCPECGLEWPNFCPIDGQRLAGAWSCSNAPQPTREGGSAASAGAGAGMLTAGASDAPGSAGAESPRLSEAERRARMAETMLVEAISPELLKRRAGAASGAEDGRDEAPAAPVAAEQAGAARRKAKRFSETQWFLKGVKAGMKADEDGEVRVDDDEYVPDETLSPEERRRHSLRAGDDSDDDTQEHT